MRFLAKNESDIGLCYDWILMDMESGVEGFADIGPTKNARILVNQLEASGHIVVLDSSPITAFTNEQIKGKAVAVRQPGSAGAATADAMLRAIGIDPAKDVKLLPMSSLDGNSALLDGTADILLGLLGFPHSTQVELASTRAIRWLDLPPDTQAKIMERMGGLPGELSGYYKGLNKPVQTVLIPAMITLHKDIADDIAYDMVKIWYDHWEERNEFHASIKANGTVEKLKLVVGSSNTPVHPGALKYYQEKGWLK